MFALCRRHAARRRRRAGVVLQLVQGVGDRVLELCRKGRSVLPKGGEAIGEAKEERVRDAGARQTLHLEGEQQKATLGAGGGLFGGGASGETLLFALNEDGGSGGHRQPRALLKWG